MEVALTLRQALSKPATPIGLGDRKSATQLDLNASVLDRILGRPDKAAGGVYQFVVPRSETLTDGGVPAPASMGTGTVLNFQPLGAGRAAVSGDFVLLANEVDPVVRALRAADIEVTALHNHMLDDQPRLFFMHFWAQGEAQRLAEGLRSALNHSRLGKE